MDNRPIGIFDSGLGGLTAVSELKKIMPNENIIYFGDTGRVPYGTRSKETIQKYTKQDIRFLLSKDVKYIIVACGTISSVISDEIVAGLPVSYTGVPIPAVKAAAKATKSGRIGVIGTPATIRSGAYERALGNINNQFSVHANACPLFVPLVESGFTNPDNEVTILVARQYLAPLIEANIDTLILGCTHYPIIKDIIQSVMGEHVRLIDSGQEAARYAFKFLAKQNMLNDAKVIATSEYYISDTVEHFATNATAILKEPVVGHVEKIDIESY
ncbi:glutamate racemase [Paludicola sp. MB14-C6]|uniref:glutamate racemase n=1 Tax=Paludihabitans sp. MB14-C6 TaxID=3070656 RepID=UPI0027DD53C4|nr:glutamate racemase [Paludicola sp. MB14-C6]WMJ22064.1 glutamate racemase [Paludicola sp. MB14-C6]